MKTTVRTGKSKSWYLSNWWMRSRCIAKRSIGGEHKTTVDVYELYVPWWAIPLNFIYSLFVPTVKLIED